MALSIIDRPKGYVLGTVGIAATASNSAGTALFTSAGHGLITGAYIYIYSALSAYNGYWYVSVIDANTFNVRSYATASNQAFINSGSVTFYKSQFTHNWNCVHLPIIYKFKSTIWPINGADTTRTITTFSNRNGYTYIVASGDIKAVGVASSLEQVILSGTSVDGVYQIIEWLSDTNFVISLAYSAANVLSSGTVQYYYFNYHARVRIYAGIKTSHIWTAQKPYGLILELKVIPDSSGIIKLNISEYIKTKIGILKNNLLKDTLPNNIDAWCNFYVTFAESYDDSNMYTVSTFVDTYTDDSGSFQGYAVNAELPFQTRSAGVLSEYVYGGTVETRQKFLTPFVRPTLFIGKYFDISFIIDDSIAVSIAVFVQILYLNGVLQNIVATSIGGVNNSGVFRKGLSMIGTEDRQDIFLASTPLTLLAPSAFVDDTGFWDGKGATAFFRSVSTGGNAAVASSYQPLVAHGGAILFMNSTITVTGTFSGRLNIIFYHDGPGAALTTSFTAPGTVTQTQTISVDSGASTRFYVELNRVGFVGLATVTILVHPGVFGYDSVYSEVKTIDVNSHCANQDRHLTWLNNLGGFDYWDFQARKVYGREIQKVVTQESNIFTDYPKSIGEFGQTRTGEIKRVTKRRETVKSQNLTAAQVDAIATIKDSPLVQIVESQYSQRTVLVDNQSFDIRKDGDKSWKISFVIVYTDEMPSQQL